MKKFFLVLAATMFVVACGSGDLTRSKAKRIIEKRPEPFLISFSKGKMLRPYDEQEQNKYMGLRDAGYVIIKESTAWVGTYWDVTPTDKLKPFMTQDGFFGTPCLVAGHYVADKITGIKKDPRGNSCSVDCVSKFVPNALTEILRVSDSQKEPKHDECILVKYDDGWRYTQRGMWIFK